MLVPARAENARLRPELPARRVLARRCAAVAPRLARRVRRARVVERERVAVEVAVETVERLEVRDDGGGIGREPGRKAPPRRVVACARRRVRASSPQVSRARTKKIEKKWRAGRRPAASPAAARRGPARAAAAPCDWATSRVRRRRSRRSARALRAREREPPRRWPPRRPRRSSRPAPS